MRDVWLVAVAAALGACHKPAAIAAEAGATEVGAVEGGPVASVAPVDSTAAPSASVAIETPPPSASGAPSAKPSASRELTLDEAAMASSGINEVLKLSCGGAMIRQQRSICGAPGGTSNNNITAPSPTANVVVSFTGPRQDGDDRTLAIVRGRLRACANRSLSLDPTEEGKAVINVSVAASGQVSATTVASTSGLSQSNTSCMSAQLRRAQFPAGPARTLAVLIAQTRNR